MTHAREGAHGGTDAVPTPADTPNRTLRKLVFFALLTIGAVIGIADVLYLSTRAEANLNAATTVLAVLGLAGLLGLTLRERSARVRERRAGDERFQLLVEGVRDYAIFMLDPRGRVATWNVGAERITGFAAGEVIGRDVGALLPGDRNGRPWASVALEKAAASSCYEEEGPHRRRDGSTYDADVVITALHEPARGSLAGFSVVIRDIPPRREAERALREAEERFRLAFASAPIGVALVSLEDDGLGHFLQVNRSLSHLIGFEEEDLLARSVADLAHPYDRPALEAGLSGLNAGESGELRLELRLTDDQGEDMWTLLHAGAVHANGGSAPYGVVQVVDITERKLFEEELQHMADHDALTGLYNGRRFKSELRRAIAEGVQHASAGALLVVDLDDFKSINDTFGHAVGDEVLARVSAAMRRRLRTTDIIGRLGGDEFAVLLPHVGLDEARAVAEDLVRVIREEATVNVEGRRVNVTTSVGLAVIHPADVDTAEELIVEADLAMYKAKKSGRDALAVSGSARRASLANPPQRPQQPLGRAPVADGDPDVVVVRPPAA